MKRMTILSFIFFFSVVLLIYGLINYYIFFRGLHALPSNIPYVKTIYSVAFILLASSYLISRFLERISTSNITTLLNLMGSLWLAAMVYFLLFVIIIDFIRLIDWRFPLLHFFINPASAKAKMSVFIAVVSVVVIIVSVGWHYAHNPVTKILEIDIDKRKASEKSQLNIVMASDLHLGGLAGKRFVNKFVNTANNLKPDIILLAGDIASEDTWALSKNNFAHALSELNAKYGVYAVTGNHEYIGGIDFTSNFIEKYGIKILSDTIINVNSKFYLVGRDDKDKIKFTGKKRKSLKSILSYKNEDLPIIMMDHQPFNLSEAEKLGIDIQFSGHTHDGQLWPFNYITKKIYEVSNGYIKKGNTHYWISSGYGWWGPPIRTSARPEIVNIIVNFQ